MVQIRDFVKEQRQIQNQASRLGYWTIGYYEGKYHFQIDIRDSREENNIHTIRMDKERAIQLRALLDEFISKY